MSAAVELTRALVALDTVNPALVPGAPGERAAVELLAARLGERGFEIGIVGPGGRPSLLATRRGRGGGRSLALSGHLDTVGVEGMDDPFAARIEGGRMYGRGTCDM
jgi:acetylornithine deacetylase